MDKNKLNVTLCGSFRKDIENLQETFSILENNFALQSPLGLNFVDSSVEFVRLHGEENSSVAEIEKKHLNAITNSDFVWLHAPEGYVGLSASMEIGFASALGIPIFTNNVLQDEMLNTLVISEY